VLGPGIALGHLRPSSIASEMVPLTAQAGSRDSQTLKLVAKETIGAGYFDL